MLNANNEDFYICEDKFNTVLKTPIISRNNGVFIVKAKPYLQMPLESIVKEIDGIINKYGNVEAQKYFNHIHMSAYSSSLAKQREWAFHMVDIFRCRVKEELKVNGILMAEIKDDTYEIEMYVWLNKL